MKLLNLTQGSPEWHTFRNQRVTATDAAVIMGLDPWTTPYKRWQQKLGLIPLPVMTPAMQRGLDMEPIAREALSTHIGLPLMDAVIENPKYPWAMASLDAIDPDLLVIAEIKCPGPEAHGSAIAGIVPEHYFAQCQHQLMVSGASQMIYWSFDGSDGVLLEVPRDHDFIERMIEAELRFYECIVEQKSPPLTEYDYKRRDDGLWQEAMMEWVEADRELDSALEREKRAKERLKELADGQSCEGCGIKLRKIVEQGRVDYKAIPELKSMDLSKYRKAPIVKWTVFKDKKNDRN